MRPGWSWRAHARQSPTYTNVCKVIRRPRLPSCGQLGPHDDAIADNLTVFEHCRKRTQIRAVGPRTLPSVWSDITFRIFPRAPPCQQVRASTSCWRSARPPLPRGPSESSHAAAVPPSGHSRNYGRRLPRFPSWFGRSSPAPPPFQSRAPGRGELLPCCSTRKGGARRWAVTPAVSLLDPALLGLGEEDLGVEGKGGTCGQAGSGARDPWGVMRPTPSCAYLPPLGSIRCPQICCVSAAATAPSRLQTPERRRAAWAAGGENCEAAGSGLIRWLLERLAVSQKCGCPFPHPLDSHLAPHPFTSPEHLQRCLS